MPILFSKAISAEEQTEIETLLNPLGKHPVVAEETLEAYAIIAAMGPTYFWFQWQTLRQLAVALRIGGNALYAAGEHAKPASHQLHAQQLSFRYPATGQEMTFIASLPAAMLDAIHRLEVQKSQPNQVSG